MCFCCCFEFVALVKPPLLVRYRSVEMDVVTIIIIIAIITIIIITVGVVVVVAATAAAAAVNLDIQLLPEAKSRHHFLAR